MAKNRENDTAQVAAMEGEDNLEELSETDGGGEEEQKDPPKPRRDRLIRRLGRFAWEHKWIGLFALGTVCISVALGVTLGLKVIALKQDQIPVMAPERLSNDNLKEESLLPFFVPLPDSAPEQVVMIDFSVIWDGVASVRFKSMELEIRNHLYRYLENLVERRKDLREKAPFLEIEMSRIFKQSLGIQDVAIKIKSIEAY